MYNHLNEKIECHKFITSVNTDDLLTYLLTPWNRSLLKKLKVPQLVKCSLMEPAGLLPPLQAPVNSLYPEPEQSSRCLPIPLLEDPLQYFPPIYA